MRESSKAALCGISAGLSVVIMMVTYLSPLLVYTAPPAAGLLIAFIDEELGGKRALGVWTAISLLSVFLIADKEAAVFFTLFFGWYPVLRPVLDGKIKNKVLRSVLKLVLYNLCLGTAVFICAFVFMIDYSDFGEGGKIMLALFWCLFIVLLFIYDVFLDKMLAVYRLRLQKRLRKLFGR